MRGLKPTECQTYLDVTSLGMFLTYLMKGNGSAEDREIVVCVPVLRLMQGRNHCCKTVVVVYVTMQAMFGGVKPPS